MRRFLKWSGTVIAAVILLMVGGFLYVTQTSFLADQAVGLANRYLAQGTRLQIGIGRISGDWIRNVTVEGVGVYAVRDGHEDTLVVLPRLSVHYDLRELLRATPMLRLVTIENPSIRLPRDSLAALVSEIFRGNLPRGRETVIPDFTLGAIVLFGGAVTVAGRGPLAEGINLQLRGQSRAGTMTLDLLPAIAQTKVLGTVSLEGSMSITGRTWIVDSLLLRTRRSDLKLSGTPAAWRVHADPIALDDINALVTIGVGGKLLFDGTVMFPGADGHWRIDGAATGDVAGFPLRNLQARFTAGHDGLQFERLKGRFAGALWNGTGGLDPARQPQAWHYDGTVRSFDLNRVARGTLRSDLSGTVHITGSGLNGRDLIIDADCDFAPGRFDGYAFDRARGRLIATGDSVTIADGFELSTHATEFVGAGMIDYDDTIDVFANVNCRDLRRWDPYVFVDSLAGVGDGFLYLSGRTSDPNVAGVIQSDSLRVYDLTTREFSGRFHVPRFLSERTGTIDARWGTSETWGVATDSISLRAKLDGTRVDIEWAQWASPYVIAEGSGRLDWASDTIPVRLYPFNVHWEGKKYSATDSVSLTVDTAGFQFHDVVFAGPLGMFHADGRVNYDQTMDLDFDISRFRLAAIWRRFFPDIQLAGLIDTRGKVQGSFADPQLSFGGTVANFTYADRPFGRLDFEAAYADQELSVSRAGLKNADFQVDAAGTFPIDLSFHPVAQRVLDRALAGRLSASGDVLDRIAAFQPDVLESINGPFAVSATVSGTPRLPRLTGDAHLRVGTIKALEIVNPIEEVTIDLSLRQDTILITKAAGIVREKKTVGTIEAMGRLQIESYDRFGYELTLTGHEVPARFEFEDFAVVSDFDLAITGSSPPRVSGKLRPSRVDDREPFQDAPITTRVEDTAIWDWDLTIDLPGNYWIHNDRIEAEMSAELRLLRRRGLVNFIGSADIIRGKVYFLDKVGRIERGTLHFDDPDNPDPRLDIDVRFRIQQPRVVGAVPGSSPDVIDLDLHVAGHASEPLIEAQPPYTEQDVILLLTTNSTGAASGDPLADRLRFLGTGLLFSEVQRVMARKLGLETLEINSAIDPKDTQITIGRYFSPHLYMYGTSPIAVGAGQELGFEYRFSRHLFLEGNRDQDNLYRLNLHLNWDY